MDQTKTKTSAQGFGQSFFTLLEPLQFVDLPLSFVPTFPKLSALPSYCLKGLVH